MLSAEYFGSGSVARDTFGHYGLASPIYTHFTSPIRRYAGMSLPPPRYLKPINRHFFTIDVLVHRQLSAAIGYTTLHPSLHSKSHVERTLDVVNKRHRMAQMAGRASVEFYVSLALKSRGEKQVVTEDAFVIRTFRNGLGVFVSKYAFYLVTAPSLFLIAISRRLGIEGLVMFKRETQFDADNYTITVPSSNGDTTIAVFDKVTVQIAVEKDPNTQRGKVKMTLLSPINSSGL